MKKIEYVTPTFEMLESIEKRMTDADRFELTITTNKEPLDALCESVDASEESFVAVIDGVPEAVFGIATSKSDSSLGIPWLIGTRAIAANARELVRKGRQLIPQWAARYAGLYNVSSITHPAAHTWMLWLGFEPIQLLYVRGHAFISFVRTS